MLKSFSVISLVATVALAQSSLIPSGISTGCSTFLTALNNDTQLANCTTTLSAALAPFAPGANITASTASVNSTLTAVCGDAVSSSCPSTLLASKITDFYTNCAAELTANPVAAVVRIYDVLYVVPAMKAAMCSKDDSGNWCVSSAKPADGTTAATIKAALYTQNNGDIIPNTDTFSKYSLPFLFLSPSSSNLCVTCTRNILNAFIQQESDVPYAPGLNNSQLLSAQTALFTAVTNQCGASFMEGEVKAAGGLSSGTSILGGSSAALPNAEFQSLVVALAGFATLVVTAFL